MHGQYYSYRIIWMQAAMHQKHNQDEYTAGVD